MVNQTMYAPQVESCRNPNPSRPINDIMRNKSVFFGENSIVPSGSLSACLKKFMSARSHWFASLRYSSRKFKLSNNRSRPPRATLISWMIWWDAHANVWIATSSPPWNHSDMAPRNCRRAASSLVMVTGSGSDAFILGVEKGATEKSRSLIELV